MPLSRAEAVNASFPQASDFRKHNAGIWPREGVYPDPTTTTQGVAYAGSGWGVGARPFVAELKRGGAPYSQAYGSARVSNDSNVASAWTISPAPASGARIDLACVRVRDSEQGDSTSGAPTDGPSGAARTGFPEFVLVTGTAATTPTKPALPAGYEELATIQTPAGASSIAGSTITPTFAFAHVVGGSIYVRNLTERNALTNLMTGDSVIVLDSGLEYIRTAAGGWAYGRGTSGLFALTFNTGNWAPFQNSAALAPRAELVSGVVQLYGRISGNATAPQIAFTLPDGMKPPRQLIALAYSVDGPVRVQVETDGNVAILDRAGQTRSDVALGGISFNGVPQ